MIQFKIAADSSLRNNVREFAINAEVLIGDQSTNLSHFKSMDNINEPKAARQQSMVKWQALHIFSPKWSQRRLSP